VAYCDEGALGIQLRRFFGKRKEIPGEMKKKRAATKAKTKSTGAAMTLIEHLQRSAKLPGLAPRAQAKFGAVARTSAGSVRKESLHGSH
jgi:hypothetical protein